MPWTIEWHDEHERAIVLRPRDPWTWDEYRDAAAQARAMIESKAHRVDMIFQFGKDVKVPKVSDEEHIAPWVPLRDEMLQSPANRGLVVLVGAPLHIESITRTLKSVVKDHQDTSYIKFADTMSEAERILAEGRE
jgi:hypothetical protein